MDKPRISLLKGTDANEDRMLQNLFKKITGRDPESIDEDVDTPELPAVIFGKPENTQVDFSKSRDDDPDDELLPKTDQSVIDILGFDPAAEN